MTINNPKLYNAAVAGASAGAASRWLTNANSASYNAQAALIETFATAFDAAIPTIPGDVNPGLADIVQAICAAFWTDRFIPPDANFAAAVAPLVAFYNSLSVVLQPDSGGGLVDSVFGRTGDVIAELGDYNSDLIINSSTVPGVTVSDALDSLKKVERSPTLMSLAETFREDWLAGVASNNTRSGIINPAFQTNRLQPTGLLWVNDPFTDTNPARFTNITEATACTLGLPGSTATLTAPGTAGNKMSLIYEGTPLNMPHLMTTVRVLSRTGVDGAYSAVLLGVVKDANNYIVINWNTIASSGNLNIQTKIAGVINFQADVNLPASNMPLTLGFSIVGNWITVYWLPETGSTQGLWQKLTSYDVTPRVDFKAQDLTQWFACFGLATPGTNVNVATYDDFKVGRFGGCGIRDICICSHPDGSPYFLSATTVAAMATLAAPSGGIAGSSQGCFTIDLEKKTFTQTGVIMVSRGGKIQNDHAAQLVIEANGDQHYLVSSWGDTPSPVKIYYKFQAAATNLLNGSNVVAATAFTLPDPGAPGAAIDYYDPYVILSATDGLYHLAYTVSTAGTGAPFYPVSAKTASLSAPVWTIIGFDNTANRYEGTRILPFEGVSYILTGGQFNMRMYDLSMNFVGVVNCLSPGDGTTQPHAMVFPYQTNNLYYLITFDQTKWPTSGGLDFSWGSHHWFTSPRY